MGEITKPPYMPAEVDSKRNIVPEPPVRRWNRVLAVPITMGTKTGLSKRIRR